MNINSKNRCKKEKIKWKKSEKTAQQDDPGLGAVLGILTTECDPNDFNY